MEELRRFKRNIELLKTSVTTLISKDIKLDKKPDIGKTLYSFKDKQVDYYQSSVKNSIVALKNSLWEIGALAKREGFEDKLGQLGEMIQDLERECNKNNLPNLLRIANAMSRFSSTIRVQEKRLASISFKIENMPNEIKPELMLDLTELKNCFNAGFYRSSVILCGRILEVALHRKYYEVTGQDILETQPGIGLGKLVAKLKEKNVALDPGIGEQIHLVNQARINSVHKKKEVFMPTNEQAQAMILYTIDIVNRLFNRKI